MVEEEEPRNSCVKTCFTPFVCTGGPERPKASSGCSVLHDESYSVFWDRLFTALGACRAVFVTLHTSHMHRKRPHPCKTGRAVAGGRKERPHGDGYSERWLSYSLCRPAREKTWALRREGWRS